LTDGLLEGPEIETVVVPATTVCGIAGEALLRKFPSPLKSAVML
jgi:hypothetical protein